MFTSRIYRRVQTTFAVEVRRSTDEKLRDTVSSQAGINDHICIYVYARILNIIYILIIYIYIKYYLDYIAKI